MHNEMKAVMGNTVIFLGLNMEEMLCFTTAIRGVKNTTAHNR